jgi:F0F1-type ATP synthase membrane subunit c/vacuolar-type H+-ATPase subunit K
MAGAMVAAVFIVAVGVGVSVSVGYVGVHGRRLVLRQPATLPYRPAVMSMMS